MPRPNVAQIQKAPRNYRPSIQSPRFESVEAAQEEDLLRAKRLRSAAAGSSSDWCMRASILADRLDPELNSHPSQTLASARYKRMLRNRIAGQIAELIDACPGTPVCNFTAIKRRWTYRVETLADANAPRIMNEFRADVNRARKAIEARRSSRLGGWIYAELHGEYEPETGTFPLHVHGTASGDMIAVLNVVRQQRGYKPWALEDGIPEATRPFLMSRRRMDDIISTVAYNMKSYWPMKRRGVVGSGATKRVRKHRRISEPFGSHVLLYLDMWSQSQISLLYGLSVRKVLIATEI